MSLWATLSPASVTSLCVDWPLRVAVFGQPDSFPALEALTLRLTSSLQYDISGITDTIAPMPHLLKVAWQSDAAIAFPAAELAEFLSTISPARRVGILELRNVRLQGEADLDAVAEKIVDFSL